jgi:CheY-like chemotaxis protein
MHTPGILLGAHNPPSIPLQVWFACDGFKMRHRDKAKILVADDSEDDLFLLTRAFEKAGLKHLLVAVPDGEQAIEYLEDELCPDLLLLDLKMPKVTGFEVLAWIRGKPEFNGLPIIVLSASDLPEDRERAKKLGATDYFVKSLDPRGMIVDLEARFLKL